MVSINRIRRDRLNLPKLAPPAGYPRRRNKTLSRNGDKTCNSGGTARVSGGSEFDHSRMTPLYRPPPSPQEIRFHAQLHERLMALVSTRRGLWSKIWRFLWGVNRLTAQTLECPMSEPNAPGDAVQQRGAAEPPAGGGLGAVSQQVCRRLAAASGPGFRDEMASLLRARLRLAVLIILSGFTLHFLRDLLPGSAYDDGTFRLLFAGCEITAMAITSALLWSRRPLSLRGLRNLELTVFGTIAAFFAWLQVDTYHDGALLRATVHGQEVFIFRLVGVTAAVRWFLLIVLYGTFIPNGWRRCATVVAILAMLPVALMIAGSQLDRSTEAYVLSALPEMIILMATAVAIAVFGSYKIRELHKKAHEAERIGQYRLKQVLGFGGMGTVYLAEHVLLRRPCAIKVISPQQAGNPRTLIRFEREVKAAARLTHWNKIEVFDYGHAEDGSFYYV